MEKIDDNQCSSAKFSKKPVVLSEDQGSRDANSANNEVKFIVCLKDIL